ncbi:hypothetical protein LINPERHAP1_LOCUS15778, partial [Linum perenne]
MTEQGDSSSASRSVTIMYCKHNVPCITKTSGTGKNPGRKFLCCRHWQDKGVD